MHPKQKLYVVVRKNLPNGPQAVQAGHALVEFAMKDPELFALWHEGSNHLCYLAAEDEEHLRVLTVEAKYRDVQCYEFAEPDLDGSLTAVCFEPTVKSAKLLSRLPLALPKVT